MAKFLSKKIDTEARKVTFTLGNGLKLEARLDDLQEPTALQCALHGISQKIGDTAAGFSKEEKFSDAYRAMQAAWDGLVEGVWSVRGSGSSDLCEALVRLGQAADTDEAAELVGAMDEETLKAVSSHPQVKKALADIRAERAAEAAKAAKESAPDLGALLGKR